VSVELSEAVVRQSAANSNHDQQQQRTFCPVPNLSSRAVVVVWLSGSTLVSINKVNLRRARLVLGWVTVTGFNSRCETFISICNQPPRSTQPGHPFVGRRNEYQSKGGDALRLGSEGRYGCVSGR